MYRSPFTDPTSPPEPASGLPQSSRSAERAYQGLTIAAMLLLLASLWLFQ